MIRKALLEKIFDATYMQRWNDKIRPVELKELDKQAHKMIISYFLGKFEEEKAGFNWIYIIEGGIFEFLQRIVITDLKPTIFYEIKKDREKYERLNNYVYDELSSVIKPLGDDFCQRFRNYFSGDDESINKKILGAAHNYSSKWEFNILKRINPEGYEMDIIEKDLDKIQRNYIDLDGIKNLAIYGEYRNFIDLCGQLRFQIRWSHLHRIPQTSVLGHLLIVAMISYLFSLEVDACEKRCVNNYFTGLFHDLPEILTRDISSPIKREIGVNELIKEYEAKKMQDEIYNLIPKEWHDDINMYTENEFSNIITIDGRVEEVNDIDKKYNDNDFNPRDGKLVRAADDLSAFIEAHLAIENGINSEKLRAAVSSIKDEYENQIISGVNLSEIYAEFK